MNTEKVLKYILAIGYTAGCFPAKNISTLAKLHFMPWSFITVYSIAFATVQVGAILFSAAIERSYSQMKWSTLISFLASGSAFIITELSLRYVCITRCSKWIRLIGQWETLNGELVNQNLQLNFPVHRTLGIILFLNVICSIIDACQSLSNFSVNILLNFSLGLNSLLSHCFVLALVTTIGFVLLRAFWALQRKIIRQVCEIKSVEGKSKNEKSEVWKMMQDFNQIEVLFSEYEKLVGPIVISLLVYYILSLLWALDGIVRRRSMILKVVEYSFYMIQNVSTMFLVCQLGEVMGNEVSHCPNTNK